MRNRLMLGLGVIFTTLGLVLVVGLGPAHAETGDANDNSCTTTNYSGGIYNGQWTRSYNPQCGNYTKANIQVSWGNTTASNGDHHIWWDAQISTGPIAGSKCVEVALDWYNPANQHSDTQFIRNCYENSTYHPSVMPQDINTQAYTRGSQWYVQRLQIGTYDPSISGYGNVTQRVCLNSSGAPPLTDTYSSCDDWLQKGAASWGSTAAKIYRKGNDGGTGNNNPTYPEQYDIWYQTDPNS